MNDQLKKFSIELKDSLIKSLSVKEVTELIAKTKSSSDEDAGSFKSVVSTSDQDRQGEKVNQNGWDLTFYKGNPVVLWAHDYASLPIGVCTSIGLVDGKLVAEGKWAPADANPFAQQVRRLYDLGMVRATSVGFIPKEWDEKDSSSITKQELLEFSFVPVPANPMALTIDQVKTLGIDTSFMKTKGIEITAKEDAPIAPPPTAEEMMAMKLSLMKNTIIDCYKKVALENQRHSKELEVSIAEITKAIAQFDGDTSAKADEPAPVVDAVAEGIKRLEDKLNVINDALKKHGLLDGIKDDKEIVTPKVEPSKALKELNDFVETRGLLRSIDNSIEKVLRNFNEAARDRKN